MTGDLLLWKFIKFCIVGFSGMIVDFGTTWVLKEKAGINKYISNSTGFILAASSNYLLNRYWTFHSKDIHIGQEYMTFIIISVIGLGISNLVVYVLTEKFKLNFYLSKLFAIGTVTIWNFSLNCLVTFR
jgi:putative flippase GtrA